MIASPSQIDELRQSLTLALETPQRYRAGAAADTLGQPPYDSAFIDRCRQALGRLVGFHDEGVIQVCSPHRKEGRSSVAAALALVLARTRSKSGVLLLDLDFARSAQADLFSVAPAPGLADYLEGREQLRAVAGSADDQLYLIPAGDHLGDPLRPIHMLSQDGMIEVFRERFQWVVLDLPPILTNPEIIALARRADWHVVVGRHRRTSVADLQKVGSAIGTEARAGFILTADTTRIPYWIRRRL